VVLYGRTGFSWPQGQRLVPTGVYSGSRGIRRLAERHNTIVYLPEHNPGNHLVAIEVPDALSANLRAFIGKVGGRPEGRSAGAAYPGIDQTALQAPPESADH